MQSAEPVEPVERVEMVETVEMVDPVELVEPAVRWDRAGKRRPSNRLKGTSFRALGFGN